MSRFETCSACGFEYYYPAERHHDEAECYGNRTAQLRICPECVQGKHGNCNGEAWDFQADQPIECECPYCVELAVQQHQGKP